MGGFRFYDLFGLLLITAAAGLAALLYGGAFEEKEKPFPYSREAGVAALVLTAIFAMRTVSFFGVYPAGVAAALCAFWLVAHRGLSLGAVGGALAGFCFDYRMAPAFLLCAVCFGLLEKSSRGGGILAGSAAAAAFAYAVARGEGIMLLLPALLTAGALFLAGDSAGLIEGSPAYRQLLHRRRAARDSARVREQEESSGRLREISGALLDLSGTFFELSNRLRRPSTADLRRLCDRSFDEVCPGCRHRDVCWGSEYRATADTVGALGSRLHSHGAVNAEQIPAPLAARCTEMPRILKRINTGVVRLTDETLRGDKTSVVAADYAAMGRILGETLEEDAEDFTCDPALGERIADRLQRLGYGVGSVAVCGKRHRRVILRDIRLPGRHLKIRDLRKILEQHCHFELGDAENRTADGICDLTFAERPRLQSLTVKETRAKGKDARYCGDSVTALSTKRGYDYALLCDGMGSGNGAALTSTLASIFLSRMLQAGSRADTALRMLNGFLASRGTRETEASTTVDLLEVDRISGEASLFKCGAAPTYLLRDGAVTRFCSRTAPVGILEALDAERIRFELKAGDLLVQVSDGVTEGEEACEWLCQMLTERYDGDTEKLTRLILNRAAEQGQDDLSVVVTEISAAPMPGEEAA
jgi:stage II sporulation protein E